MSRAIAMYVYGIDLSDIDLPKSLADESARLFLEPYSAGNEPRAFGIELPGEINDINSEMGSEYPAITDEVKAAYQEKLNLLTRKEQTSLLHLAMQSEHPEPRLFLLWYTS